MPQHGKIFCWIYLINCKFVITNQIPGGTRRGLQLVKKVLTDFFDKLLSKLQNRNKEDYFAILPAAAGLWNVKGNPDGSLSHFSSLRNLSLGSSLTV